METEEEYQLNWEITEAMMRFGGSFVKQWANLFRLADPNNRQKLKDAFPEYWDEYTKVVVMKRCNNPEWYDK